jgi:hypothetical protein
MGLPAAPTGRTYNDIVKETFFFSLTFSFIFHMWAMQVEEKLKLPLNFDIGAPSLSVQFHDRPQLTDSCSDAHILSLM